MLFLAQLLREGWLWSGNIFVFRTPLCPQQNLDFAFSCQCSASKLSTESAGSWADRIGQSKHSCIFKSKNYPIQFFNFSTLGHRDWKYGIHTSPSQDCFLFLWKKVYIYMYILSYRFFLFCKLLQPLRIWQKKKIPMNPHHDQTSSAILLPGLDLVHTHNSPQYSSLHRHKPFQKSLYISSPVFGNDAVHTDI